jgi:hypothetical protein
MSECGIVTRAAYSRPVSSLLLTSVAALWGLGVVMAVSLAAAAREPLDS